VYICVYTHIQTYSHRIYNNLETGIKFFNEKSGWTEVEKVKLFDSMALLRKEIRQLVALLQKEMCNQWLFGGTDMQLVALLRKEMCN